MDSSRLPSPLPARSPGFASTGVGIEVASDNAARGGPSPSSGGGAGDGSTSNAGYPGLTLGPAKVRKDNPLDAQWLKRAQAGDRAAFGQFVLATQDRLYTLLVRIVGDRDEAKELAQDSYLRALQAISTFRGAASPYTWLYRIGVNLAIARLRKVRRQRVFSLDAPLPSAAHDGNGAARDLHDESGRGGGDPAELALRQERNRQVLLALGRLDAEYRAVLVMRDVDDLDYREISEVLELPIGTVKSRLFRARLALREELNRYFAPPTTSPGSSSASPGGSSFNASGGGGLL